MNALIDWQASPHIDIVTEPISDDTFFEGFGSGRGRPVLLKGLGKTWPSHSRWSLEMFKEKYGSQQIEAVRLKRSGYDVKRQTVSMSLGEYIDYLKSPGSVDPLYLTDWVISESMEDDLRIPSYFSSWHHALPSEMQPRLSWCYIGPSGSGSPMHQDVMGTSAFNVVITGRKAWVFFEPDEDVAMYGGRVDAFNPDLKTFPNYAFAKGWKCIQEPGDVVFTPSNWWHQVNNEVGGISYTGNFVNRSNLAHVRKELIQSPELREMVAFLDAYNRMTAVTV